MSSQIKDQKERAQAIQDMLGTRGWEIIQEELIEEARLLHTKLLAAPDGSPDERQFKHEEKAIQTLLEKVTSYALIKT